MDRFEILMSQTIQFSLFNLLHISFSNYIVERINQIDISFQNKELIKKVITSKNDIIELKIFLEKNHNMLEINNLYNEFIEEFNEIKSDFKWLNSRDGKLIIKIEHWVEAERKKLLENFNDCKIFVGRSILNPKQLIIGGILQNELEIEKIKNFVSLRKPPVPVTYKFETETYKER